MVCGRDPPGAAPTRDIEHALAIGSEEAVEAVSVDVDEASRKLRVLAMQRASKLFVSRISRQLAQTVQLGRSTDGWSRTALNTSMSNEFESESIAPGLKFPARKTAPDPRNGSQ